MEDGDVSGEKPLLLHFPYRSTHSSCLPEALAYSKFSLVWVVVIGRFLLREKFAAEQLSADWLKSAEY